MIQFFSSFWKLLLELIYGDKEEPDMPEEVKPVEVKPPQTVCDAIFELSREALGKDISPNDIAPDTLGCAESVSNVIRQIYPDFPILVSTIDLSNHLFKDKRFRGTLQYKPGVIIVSPTGSGNGSVIGHTGIFHYDAVIASNTSKTGLWEENYTLSSWVDRFRMLGGLKIYFFEPLGTVDKPT